MQILGKFFVWDHQQRSGGESLPWLSITCWVSALWGSSVARTPLLWLLNVGCHFTPASVASSLTFPVTAINVLGVSVSLSYITFSPSRTRVNFFLPIKKSKCYQLADELQFHELWSPGKGNEAQQRWERVSLHCFLVFQSGGAPTHTKIK